MAHPPQRFRQACHPLLQVGYEQEGAREPLLLLHGGFCTNATWEAQRPDFATRYRLFLAERRGHGHTPDVAGPLSCQDMADDTIAFIESVVNGPAHLVGWSDGAIVALQVAIARPDLVRKVVAMGANFRPLPESGAVPDMFDHMTPTGPTWRSSVRCTKPRRLTAPTTGRSS